MNFSNKKNKENLSELAEKAKELGLEKPLEFMVEAHYPLSNLLYHLSLLLEPIMRPFLSVSRVSQFTSVFADEKKRSDFLSKLRSE